MQNTISNDANGILNKQNTMTNISKKKYTVPAEPLEFTTQILSLLKINPATFGNPVNGTLLLFQDVDGVIKTKNSAGTITPISSGGGTNGSSRIVSVRIGKENLSSASAEIQIVQLVKDEYITMVATELIEQFIPTSPNELQSVLLEDVTTGYTLRNMDNCLAGMKCVTVDRVYPENVRCGIQKSIHSNAIRSINVRINSSTDAGYSSGVMIVYLKIESMPSPILLRSLSNKNK